MDFVYCRPVLTHYWGRVTHICVGKLTSIGSDNVLSPGRRQDIIWISAGILLIGPLGTNFSDILIGDQIFSFKKMHLKMSSKWLSFCPGFNVLTSFTSIRFDWPNLDSDCIRWSLWYFYPCMQASIKTQHHHRYAHVFLRGGPFYWICLAVPFPSSVEPKRTG